MKFLMSLLAALFMVGSAQAVGRTGPMIMVVQDAADAKSYFWNQKVGSVSTFAVTVDTDAGALVLGECTSEVTSVDLPGDANHQAVFKQAFNGNSSNFGGVSSKGLYCWGPVDKDGKVKPVMAMFKYDAKVGDTWDGWAEKPGPNAPDVTMKYVASDEKVKTAAGDFNAIHVQASVKDGVTVDYYFAAGKGLIRVDTKSADFVKHLSLSNFTEGK